MNFMQDSNLKLKDHVFLQIIGFEWMKSAFPFSEFVNKANYLLDKKQMREMNKKIQLLVRKTGLNLTGIDQICKNGNQNAFIYVENKIRNDETGDIRIVKTKLSVIDMNMEIYNEIITPIHRYLKEWGKRELDL